MTGKVKWWNDRRSFGFLTPDDGSEEAFVHYSDIRMTGHKSLTTGQAVRYEVVSTAKGPKAVNVRPLEDVHARCAERFADR